MWSPVNTGGREEKTMFGNAIARSVDMYAEGVERTEKIGGDECVEDQATGSACLGEGKNVATR
jgi:hypothetical protein